MGTGREEQLWAVHVMRLRANHHRQDEIQRYIPGRPVLHMQEDDERYLYHIGTKVNKAVVAGKLFIYLFCNDVLGG